jgi:hypothetical protein
MVRCQGVRCMRGSVCACMAVGVGEVGWGYMWVRIVKVGIIGCKIDAVVGEVN